MRILARRDPIDPLWRTLRPEVVLGDVADEGALARLCRGADVVVHAAGLVKAPSRAAFDAVNVEGSRRVALAARDTPHVLLISSLTAREPGLSHYSASKAGGEAVMRGVLGSRLTIARPCAIYGPGDRELLPVFQAAGISPVLPVLGERARITMIHVADAAAQAAALAAAPSSDRPLVLCDSRPEGYSWRELMAAAARAAGRSPILAPVPRALVRLIGVTNDFSALLGASPMLTSAKARELLFPAWTASPQEIPASKPAPRHDLDSGFSDTMTWYRAQGWLKQ